MAPKRRSPSTRRRNPTNPLGIFLSGLGGTITASLGSAVETIILSAGAVAVDRLILRRGQTLPAATVNPSTSPDHLAQFLRSNHQIAALVGAAPVLQSGTLPDGTTHEVVFAIPGGRLAARCTADGQITLKQLPPEPAPAPPPAATFTDPIRPHQSRVADAADLPIIDCTQSKTGEWEPA